MTDNHDAHYMGLALAQARKAAQAGEVPVGAVLLAPGHNGGQDVILASAHNQPIGLCDPSAHAEMLALRAAAAALGNYRLDGCTLYVTLEPCAMCAQALLHARIARVVYGAREPKTGAAGSVIDIFGHPLLNHQTQVSGGAEAEACAALLQAFFAGQRVRAKLESVPLRQDALRTPEACFEPIWQAWPHLQSARRWTSAGSALSSLRLHWLELPASTDPMQAAPVTVALHGPGAWWPQWLERARAEQAAGRRVWLPDLIGCGMSDKPKHPRWHTVARHAEVLAEWLMAQQQDSLDGLRLLAPPEMAPLAQALRGLLTQQEVTLDIVPAPDPQGLPDSWLDLPYPDAGHAAVRKAWPWPEA